MKGKGMIKNSLFRKKEEPETQDGAGTINEAYYAPEQMNSAEVQYGSYAQNATNGTESQYGTGGAAYGAGVSQVQYSQSAAGTSQVQYAQSAAESSQGQYSQNTAGSSQGQYSQSSAGGSQGEYAQDYAEQTHSQSDSSGAAQTTGQSGEYTPDSFTTLSIPLDQIDENPINDKIFNMKGIESLMTGIEKDGYLQAIGVFLKDDGRYEIFTGHRRYRAMKKLYEEGKLSNPTIPGVVFPMPENEDEKTEKLISSNIRNRPEEPMDMARAIYEYESIRTKKKDYTGKLRDAVADYFGISPTKVYRFECLMRLIPELQELANTHGVNYNVLSRASMLSEEDQHRLYDILIKYAKAEIAVVKQEIKNQGNREEGINEINFEEITARVLSGQKINTEINNLLEENEEDTDSFRSNDDPGPDNTDSVETEEEEEPITGFMVNANEDESEDESDADEDSDEDESEEEEETEGRTVAARTSSRKSINKYMTELEKMVESDDEILNDKEEIRNYLDRLKKLIAVLEKML